MGKNCALGLEYGSRPTASGRTQDLGHSFFPIRTSRPVNNTYILSLVYIECAGYLYTNCDVNWETYMFTSCKHVYPCILTAITSVAPVTAENN